MIAIFKQTSGGGPLTQALGPMSSQLKELISVLDDLIILLRADGQSRWSKWMQEARVRLLRNDEYSGVTYLLGAYGGMGSFNDLVLGDDPSNTRFERLREQAWALADKMRASLTEPD